MKKITVLLLLLVCMVAFVGASNAESCWNKEISVVDPKPSVVWPVFEWAKNTVTFAFTGTYPPDTEWDTSFDGNFYKNLSDADPMQGKTRNPNMYELERENTN